MAGRLMDRVKSLVEAAVRDLSDAPPRDSAIGQLQRLDLALSDVREQLGVALARRHQVSKQVKERSAGAEAVAAKAAIAIASDREDLARAAFEHQREAEAVADAARAELAELEQETAQLELFAARLSAARAVLTGSPTIQDRTAALAELDALVARVAAEEAR